MAQKKKTKDPIPTSGPEERPSVVSEETPVATASKPAPVPTPKPPVLPTRSGILGQRKPVPAHLAALASATGTSPMVLAALKSAYGWTDRTKLTRQDFLQRRDEWLNRPANEV